MDNNNNSRITASLKLFEEFNCCSSDLMGVIDDVDERYYDAALALVDEDKIRSQVINCMIALQFVQVQRRKREKFADDKKLDLVKSKVFKAAIMMILDDDFDRDRDQTIIDIILSTFPNEGRISNVRSWLPIHFATALTVDDKISEDDIDVFCRSFGDALIEEER